jgi:hypothetical protein
MHAVSMIPIAQLLKHAVSLTPLSRCMWFHLHRMHGSCRIIDITCMVHVVSLTPHAKSNLQTTLKNENYWRNGLAIHNACGVIDTAWTVTPHAK